MKRTLEDKIMSKVSKGKINTIHVSREEMVEMVEKYFIQEAKTEEDYQAIWKVIKRSILGHRTLDSKDGNYQLKSCSSQGGRSLRKYVWIYDRAADTYYEYEYFYGFYGKFKKMVCSKLLEKQNQ